jgi:hypothetical protein
VDRRAEIDVQERRDTPIVLSGHAKDRLAQRGTTAEEVASTVREGDWQPAKRGKQHAAKRFEFGGLSPVNGLVYRYKTVDVVFADEAERIFVVTVKVYYSN